MRIRSIKPEFWRSPDINHLDLEDRLLFIGLWSYVDDNGVGKDELPVVVADLFAGDMFANSSETVARVSRGLSKLFEAGLIDRYKVSDKPYLMIVKWEAHQRIDKPAKARFPRSDGDCEVIRDTLATPSRDSRDTLAPGTGEQGSRGAGEQGSRGTVSPAPSVLVSAFETAWAHWPKKVERKKALEQWKVAARRIPVDELSAHVIRFGDAYAATTEKQFVPALNVWLNRERWTDELPEGRTTDGKLSNAQRGLSLVDHYARLEGLGELSA